MAEVESNEAEPNANEPDAVESDEAGLNEAEADSEAASGHVVLTGDLGIAQVQELYQRLAAAMATDGAIAIDAAGLKQVDTSVVQLLVSMIRSAGKEGRAVAWLGVSDALREAATQIGLASEMGFPE